MVSFNLLKVSQSRAIIDSFCQDEGFELTYYIETLITIVCAYLMISLRRCHFSFPLGWRGLLFVFSAIRLVFGFVVRVWTSLFILRRNTPRIVRNSRCNRSWWGWQTGSNYRGDFTFRSSVFFSFGRLSLLINDQKNTC